MVNYMNLIQPIDGQYLTSGYFIFTTAIVVVTVVLGLWFFDERKDEEETSLLPSKGGKNDAGYFDSCGCLTPEYRSDDDSILVVKK